jgi:hypothetical protein
MGVSNSDEDGSGVDGDGSGGNSLSRQGAEIKTSVPQNLSSMAVALRNFSWMEASSSRVFALGAIYRWKGDVGGCSRGPHRSQAWPGMGLRHGMVWPPPGSSLSPLWTPSLCQKNRNFGFCFVSIPLIFSLVKI